MLSLKQKINRKYSIDGIYIDMTQTFEISNSSNVSQQEPLAYSALLDPEHPERRQYTEDELARSADNLQEGLEHFLRFQQEVMPQPEAKLETLLDIVKIAHDQAAATNGLPLPAEQLEALKELVVDSAQEVVAEDRIGQDGQPIEPMLIDAYLLEKAASALESFPEDQDKVIKACLRVVEKIHKRDPGLVDSIPVAIEKYVNQDKVPIDPEHPEVHKTLDEALRTVEAPQINAAMAAYERRIDEREMSAGTIGTGVRRPTFETAALPTLERPEHKKATIDLGTAAYKTMQAEEKYGKTKIA